MIQSTYLLKGRQEILNPSLFQQYLSNDLDYFATRVAYKLNLKGPAIGVQTACLVH